MKVYCFLLIFYTFFISAKAQDLIPASEDETMDTRYYLPTPEGWGTERIPFPINFAPEIPYTGTEDLRFATGWAKVHSEEYWTYAFLWYLNDKPKTNAKIIAENLKNYYAGLIKSNSDSTKVSTEKPIPVTTSFKKVKTDKADLETYKGSIKMMDYMQKKPISLNCIVHLKICEEDKKTVLFYELSPKPFTHNNWLKLEKLWTDFKCRKE